MTTTTDLVTVKRHPIRGAIWGLIFGLGLAVFLIGQKIVAFGTLPPILVVAAGLVAGVVWGFVGPAKGDGAPPLAPTGSDAREAPGEPLPPGEPEQPSRTDVAMDTIPPDDEPPEQQSP